MELWQPIYGFENLYEISNYGNLKSFVPANYMQRTLDNFAIQRIFNLSEQGFSARKIAFEIGISQPVISKILRGDAYKNRIKLLAQALRRDGYMFVTLSKDNKHFHKTIHGMVAEMFIGHRPNDCFVNHIDGVKTNNSISNLEYVTKKGNMQHALYELKKSHKLTFDQAKDIWYAKQRGEKRKNLAAKHNVSIHMITAIWMGKSWWHAR